MYRCILLAGRIKRGGVKGGDVYVFSLCLFFCLFVWVCVSLSILFYLSIHSPARLLPSLFFPPSPSFALFPPISLPAQLASASLNPTVLFPSFPRFSKEKKKTTGRQYPQNGKTGFREGVGRRRKMLWVASPESATPYLSTPFPYPSNALPILYHKHPPPKTPIPESGEKRKKKCYG